jgi:hypothetical protein
MRYASEMIKTLQELVTQHGDLPVIVYDHDRDIDLPDVDDPEHNVDNTETGGVFSIPARRDDRVL